MQQQQTGGGGRSPADITKVLQGLNFPAQKEDLVQQAESNNADSGILDMLKNIPPGAYNSIGEVLERLGMPAGVADAIKGMGLRH